MGAVSETAPAKKEIRLQEVSAGATYTPADVKQGAGSLPTSTGGEIGGKLRLGDHVLHLSLGASNRKLATTDTSPTVSVVDFKVAADLVHEWTALQAGRAKLRLGEQVGLEAVTSWSPGQGDVAGGLYARTTYTPAAISLGPVGIDLMQLRLKVPILKDDDSMPPFAAEAVLNVRYHLDDSLGAEDDIKTLQRELEQLEGLKTTQRIEWIKKTMWERARDQLQTEKPLPNVVMELWRDSIADAGGDRWDELGQLVRRRFLRATDVKRLAAGQLSEDEIDELNRALESLPMGQILSEGGALSLRLEKILLAVNRTELNPVLKKQVDDFNSLYDSTFNGLDERIQFKRAELVTAERHRREAMAYYQMSNTPILGLTNLRLYEAADPTAATPGLKAKVNQLTLGIQTWNDMMLIRAVQAVNEDAPKPIAVGYSVVGGALGSAAMIYGAVGKKPGMFHSGLMLDTSLLLSLESLLASPEDPRRAKGNDLRLRLSLAAATLMALAGGAILVKDDSQSPWGLGMMGGAVAHASMGLFMFTFGP
ncbi:MAG: hypothetical protein HYT77_02560 [Deltaproteobacteria bacterium]|nr:hypothetical protein [Deltaproteobacteria bacterium]